MRCRGPGPQSQKRTRNAQRAELMRFRIGVHLGDVIVDEGKTCLATASTSLLRLQALAQPGGICLFWQWCAIKSEPDCRWLWSPWARHEAVKNICRSGSCLQDWRNARTGTRRPVHLRSGTEVGPKPALSARLVVLIATGGAAWWLWPQPQAPNNVPPRVETGRSRRWVATQLPRRDCRLSCCRSANLSNDPQQEYFRRTALPKTSRPMVRAHPGKLGDSPQHRLYL